MAAFSRRSLANYAVEQLLANQSPAQLSKYLAAALIASKRQDQADLLLADINQELESRGRLANATVTSATKLSAELRKSLSSQVKKAAKVDQVSLNEQIDPSVIGGIRIETANHTWDKTVARKLSEIKGGI